MNSEIESGDQTDGTAEQATQSTTSGTVSLTNDETMEMVAEQAANDIANMAEAFSREFYIKAQKAKTRMDRRNNLIRGDTLLQFAAFVRELGNDRQG